MVKRLRKALLLAAKLLIAASLLTWVISKVHWHDTVIEAETGKKLAVLGTEAGPDGRVTYRVAEGPFWRRVVQQPRSAEQFDAVGGEVVRPGFATTISSVRVLLLAAASVGFIAAILIIAVRWRFLLRIQDIRISRWEAVRLTFLGHLFNLVVPGTVGGDLVKAYYVARHTPRKAAALVSIFVDRVLGLVEMTLLAGIMVAIALAGGLAEPSTLQKPLAALGVIVVVAGVALVFLLSRRFRRALHLQKLYQRLPVAHHIAAAGDAAHRYGQNLPALGKALALTFVAHLCWVGSIATVGASLGLATPVYRYFMNIPVIYIIGSVPLTPGGVGLIESLYLEFFSAASVTSSQILALALLARVIPAIWTLPGIIVAIRGPKLPTAETIEAELSLKTDADQ